MRAAKKRYRTSSFIHAVKSRDWIPETLSSESGQEWRIKAACTGVNPDLFTLLDQEDTGAGVIKTRSINRENFKKGREYCDECPVKTACHADGLDNGDLEYTMRGGVSPYDLQDAAKPKPPALDLPAAWAAYVDGRDARKVRRSAHGPLTGPWPAWERHVRKMRKTLPRVLWNNREGWVLRYPDEHPDMMYALFIRERAAGERIMIPLADSRLLD